jgi:hypothetical protein
MNKLVAAAILAGFVASPAFAQSYDPSIGTGNLDSVPYQAAPPPSQGSTPYDARAQVPQGTQPHRAPAPTPLFHNGRRSPYAQYDAEGNLIDQNMPGRW